MDERAPKFPWGKQECTSNFAEIFYDFDHTRYEYRRPMNARAFRKNRGVIWIGKSMLTAGTGGDVRAAEDYPLADPI